MRSFSIKQQYTHVGNGLVCLHRVPERIFSRTFEAGVHQTIPDIRLQASINRTGRDHLEERSRLRLRIRALAPIQSILIIDDVVFDGDVLASSLRIVFGHGVRITQVRTLQSVRKAIAETKPDLIFLDDRLGHSVSAETSLEVIRQAGYVRPIIIMSGLLTRARQIELGRMGAADIVHKDDCNTGRLSEAVLKALESDTGRDR